MPRPGFVLQVDDKTPALLTLSGAAVGLRHLGHGVQVVYPPDAVASQDPIGLIDQGLATPISGPALDSLLSPETRLVIVVSDTVPPLPQLRFDPRRALLERVLELAARAGVDDVQIVIASGIGRRWSPHDITNILGPRVAMSFLPDGRITSHDITADDLVSIGEVDGAPVLINQRVARADVVVTIDTSGGAKDAPVEAYGITDLATLNRIDGYRGSRALGLRVRDAVVSAITSFAITAVVGQPLLPSPLGFLNKREWEWRLPDHLAYAGTRQLVAAMPRQGGRRLYAKPVADYAVLDVIGGEPGKVATQARQVWATSNSVRVASQSDVLVVSAWGSEFDAGNPVGSPLRAAEHVLVDRAGGHTGTPFLREAGVVVAFHPLTPTFSNRTQSSAADFFSTVLSQTLDPAEIHESFESRALQDPWYTNLYREHNAFHQAHVFHSWYRIVAASRTVGEVIWVGADRRAAATLGHRAASSYADALELASNRVGADPSITYLHSPGRLVGEVG
ncbi:MAG: lactate racemase domain-containing protein [Arachnia sp.]